MDNGASAIGDPSCASVVYSKIIDSLHSRGVKAEYMWLVDTCHSGACLAHMEKAANRFGYPTIVLVSSISCHDSSSNWWVDVNICGKKVSVATSSYFHQRFFAGLRAKDAQDLQTVIQNINVLKVDERYLDSRLRKFGNPNTLIRHWFSNRASRNRQSVKSCGVERWKYGDFLWKHSRGESLEEAEKEHEEFRMLIEGSAFYLGVNLTFCGGGGERECRLTRKQAKRKRFLISHIRDYCNLSFRAFKPDFDVLDAFVAQRRVCEIVAAFEVVSRRLWSDPQRAAFHANQPTNYLPSFLPTLWLYAMMF